MQPINKLSQEKNKLKGGFRGGTEGALSPGAESFGA